MGTRTEEEAGSSSSKNFFQFFFWNGLLWTSAFVSALSLRLRSFRGTRLASASSFASKAAWPGGGADRARPLASGHPWGSYLAREERCLLVAALSESLLAPVGLLALPVFGVLVLDRSGAGSLQRIDVHDDSCLE